ncbi:hypothetical protein TL16_g07729 [Triparma laevis f. inornata]|uniref:Uncharacterized protein n=1 Tax=Triparma laevis f. inornata TaxID=1714386 RepID=A0A9W7EHM4_9STRA|nr:hypothetical protein TL16_g07729 [Triparma laevis f. inornata]
MEYLTEGSEGYASALRQAAEGAVSDFQKRTASISQERRRNILAISFTSFTLFIVLFGKAAYKSFNSTSAEIISDVFLQLAAEEEETKKAISSIIGSILRSPEVNNEVNTLIKNVFADLTTDKETVANAANLISAALQDPVVMKSVNELAVHLCSDPEVMDASAKLIIELGLQEEITEATAKLLTNSSHVVMSDPEILDHSKEFVADVVADDAIQRTGGDALWNTITYSVRPGEVELRAGVSSEASTYR